MEIQWFEDGDELESMIFDGYNVVADAEDPAYQSEYSNFCNSVHEVVSKNASIIKDGTDTRNYEFCWISEVSGDRAMVLVTLRTPKNIFKVVSDIKNHLDENWKGYQVGIDGMTNERVIYNICLRSGEPVAVFASKKDYFINLLLQRKSED